MAVVKWSDDVEWFRDGIVATMFNGLYKKYIGYIAPWLGKKPYYKMDWF